MESNIIYNFEDFKVLLLDKAREGAYYLLSDDIFFEKIEKNKVITREVFSIAKDFAGPLSVIKYISFKVDKSCSTTDIYELIQLVREDTNIIVTIFNPKIKEVFIIFISNKNNSILEEHIKNFLEMEVIN